MIDDDARRRAPGGAEPAYRELGTGRAPTVRAAAASDAGAIARIWESGWREAHLGHVPEALVAARTPESWHPRALAAVDRTAVAVDDDGVVTGFVTVAGDELEQLYVDGTHRGGRVASALLAEGERRIAADGHAVAWLAVVAGNARARRFYARSGWVDEGPFVHDAPGGVEVQARRYVRDRYAVLVHGPRPALVELSEHDPRWPAFFAAERDRIVAALGARARLVEHIGSTSVPGLAAKPIVDVVVGVENPDDEDAYLPALYAEGYDLRVREPGHRGLRAERDTGPVNLHCYAPGSDEVRRYLLLRDRLRAHPGDRARYEATKRELAGREYADVNDYADAKGPTIFAILRDAGWTPPEQG